MSKIFKYIIAGSLLLCTGLPAGAQTTSKGETTTPDSVATPLFQALYVELDVAPLIETTLINKYAYTLQGHVMAQLSERFFPLVEFGLSGANHTNTNTAYFNTKGVFGKIGIDFRLLTPKPDATIKTNNLLGGLRLGMSHATYSLGNLLMTDPYWGGKETINQTGLTSTKLWIELAAGVRVAVAKNIYMGWNVRHKLLLNPTKEGNTAPWYIPGYGLGKSASVWGFSYVIGIRINTAGK